MSTQHAYPYDLALRMILGAKGKDTWGKETRSKLSIQYDDGGFVVAEVKLPYGRDGMTIAVIEDTVEAALSNLAHRVDLIKQGVGSR